MALDPIAQSTYPALLMLRAIRSDSLTIKVRLYDARTGRPIVLTGYSGAALIFATENSSVATHELDVEVDQAAAGQATTGLVTITLDGNQSTTWLEDGYWSLVLIDDPIRKTIISGPWQMSGPAPGTKAHPCGLCSVPGFEQLGVDCDVTRYGYTILKLPLPQPTCSCC
jgi:hypothetical protein